MGMVDSYIPCGVARDKPLRQTLLVCCSYSNTVTVNSEVYFNKFAGCQGILGVSTGLIKDSQLSASSSYDERHQPYHARLNKTVQGSRGGWCSAFADETEFLEVNLGNKTNVSGTYDVFIVEFKMSSLQPEFLFFDN